MEIRAVFHKQHQSDFRKGFEAKMAEIQEMGFVAARDKFNAENPVGQSHGNLGAYYFASGEAEALTMTAH